MAGCGGEGHGGAIRSPDALVAVIKGLDNPLFRTMREGLVSTRAMGTGVGQPARVAVPSGTHHNLARVQASSPQPPEAFADPLAALQPAPT
jgi:hypothetical protein